MLLPFILGASLLANVPLTGAYRLPSRTVYVGPEAYPATHRYTEYFDTRTRRFGELRRVRGSQYVTAQKPQMYFNLSAPAVAVREERTSASDTQGEIAFSLWHAPNARSRPTILLIHGSDDETRDMGFLIPYFVAHGLNVVSYDQRGTGESAGDWHSASASQKADDVMAILTSVERNPAVDRKRIGLWGTSNGGWVAPIVATRYPVAFMILRSAPAQSVADNVLFEIREQLKEHKFSEGQIADAIAFDRTVFAAIRSDSNWPRVQQLLETASTQPWMSYTRIPDGFTAPPAPEMLTQLQGVLAYDPAPTLEKVRVPTFALFGALDRNVDAGDSAERMSRYFRTAGLSDFTVRTYPAADHVLEASSVGYLDQPLMPQRLVSGYPEAMAQWLAAHGYSSSP